MTKLKGLVMMMSLIYNKLLIWLRSLNSVEMFKKLKFFKIPLSKLRTGLSLIHQVMTIFN